MKDNTDVKHENILTKFRYDIQTAKIKNDYQRVREIQQDMDSYLEEYEAKG